MTQITKPGEEERRIVVTPFKEEPVAPEPQEVPVEEPEPVPAGLYEFVLSNVVKGRPLTRDQLDQLEWE